MRAKYSAFLIISISVFLLSVSPVFAAMGSGMCCGGGGGGTGSSPLTTFTTADFSGSGNCAFCHSALRDSAGNDVSIDTHWRSTMMANSGKDPLWQGKISSEIFRNPSFKAVIEEKCTRCHMGMARYQALTDGNQVSVFAPGGFLDQANYLNKAALDGVSCTLCHQITPSNLGLPASFTGHYLIDTSTNPPYRPAYGPYAQPLRNPMEMHVGYSPTQGEQISSSEMCGSCHTLYTPTIDSKGTVIGEFPEQTTYLEWKEAVNGGGVSLSCRECHLPQASGPVIISNRPMRLAARSPFSQHHFTGGNSFMLNLIKTNMSAVGATATTAQFDATIARTNNMLQKDSATITVSSSSLSQNTLTAILLIQNKTGHKLPSGIPARRAWLHVTMKNKYGQIVFESGKPMPDGSISGNDGDMPSGLHEPHYDLITSSGQVQIYEVVMLDSDGKVTHTLLRAASYLKDNRLLPAGFIKESVKADIAVRGEASYDPNFTGGGDQITYQVTVDNTQKPFTLSAELLYQAVSYPFAEDLRRDNIALGNRFMSMFDASGKSPSLLSSVQKTIQ